MSGQPLAGTVCSEGSCRTCRSSLRKQLEQCQLGHSATGAPHPGKLFFPFSSPLGKLLQAEISILVLILLWPGEPLFNFMDSGWKSVIPGQQKAVHRVPVVGCVRGSGRQTMVPTLRLSEAEGMRSQKPQLGSISRGTCLALAALLGSGLEKELAGVLCLSDRGNCSDINKEAGKMNACDPGVLRRCLALVVCAEPSRGRSPERSQRSRQALRSRPGVTG